MWIMMNRKVFTMLFGLLLAVGWTSSAQTQALQRQKVTTTATNVDNKSLLETIGQPKVKWDIFSGMNQGHQFRAPMRSQNFSATSPVTHPKSWYQALPNVTWTGGSQNITEPFTTADGMIALLKRVYTDRNIPGFKYSENRQNDIPYQTIEYGWNINGTNYNDDILIQAHPYVAIYEIGIWDANGNALGSWNAYDNGTTLPSSWTTTGITSTYYGDVYLPANGSSAGSITIPASYLRSLNNTTSYFDVRVFAYNYKSSSSVDNAQLAITSPTYPGLAMVSNPPYSTQYVYRNDYYLPGTITPPDDAGYTVMLVKLQDEFPEGDVPEYTADEDALKTFFTNYVKEIDLLTDGLRVDEGHDDAGTVFAYTGDVNRFYFIGKGKLAYGKSLFEFPFDRAPFYSMYEEFSPYVAGGSEDHSDFYEKMKQGKTYPIIHDCEGVIYLDHYFSMSGAQGVTENRVNCLVFYIPDNRGISSEWQNYDPEHQPTVGMYMIDLYADVQPSATQTDYYTVTVDWFSNLDTLTHTDNIPQTYKLYEIRYNEQTGKNDTTLVYSGMNSSWTVDYPVGDPRYYDLHYYVVGTPVGEGGTTENPTYTNPDFFAKSNTDDVTIPGKYDFLGLQWQRYESDYVILNKAEQVNYYRNWLAPHALSVQGEAGINAGNVGAAGRTLTLYRNDGNSETPIMDLDLIMDGNKAYYRIRYRSNTQQVEPGYDPQTGELTTNNNNN